MDESVFQYNAKNWSVTPAMKEAYNKNGFVILRNVLSDAEIQKLRSALENSKGVLSHAHSRDDGDGRRSHIALWNHPGHDITGILARMQRVAGVMQE
ncbi:hypothetical protein SK128_003499, partial [Halocaridina rubra]